MLCTMSRLRMPNAGEYFLLVGVDGGLSLWSYMGICLQPLQVSAETPEVTACCFLPSGPRIAFTTRQGDLGIAQLRLPVVHGLYREMYARRTALCEVAVRNLLTDMTTTIQYGKRQLFSHMECIRAAYWIFMSACCFASTKHSQSKIRLPSCLPLRTNMNE